MENVENMEYNTTRNHLEIREYGRHIQKMVEYVLTLEDREKRQKNAYALIELMGFLNPHLKNVEDFRHKLWDHLFLISDFKLDVDSPYPIPTRETLKAKPAPLEYPKRYPKYNHLGKNIEIVIDKRAINSRRLKDFVEYYQNEKVPKASLARMILAWRFAGVGVLMYLADEAGYHREMAEIDGKPALIFSPPTTTPTD